MIAANGPRFIPTNKLNPPKFKSSFATEAFAFGPGNREWHDRI
jgi:hypothetical protein